MSLKFSKLEPLVSKHVSLNNGKVYPSPERDLRIKANVWAFINAGMTARLPSLAFWENCPLSCLPCLS